MQRRSGFWLSLLLAAAIQAPTAAAESPGRSTAAAGERASEAVAAADPKAADRQGARKSRLRFKTVDGTCACTCASGGISEEEIRKAHEARERGST